MNFKFSACLLIVRVTFFPFTNVSIFIFPRVFPRGNNGSLKFILYSFFQNEAVHQAVKSLIQREQEYDPKRYECL